MSLFYLFSPSQTDVARNQMYDVSPYQINVDFEDVNNNRPTVFEIEGEPNVSTTTREESNGEEDETMESKEEELDPTSKLNKMYSDQDDFLDQVLGFEEMFSQNSYQGDTSGEGAFQYKKGNLPVLISAPHAIEQYRNGDIKSADIYTGSMALFLHNLTNSHVLFASQIGDDPNYVEGGSYKEKIQEVIDEHNIQYVIDLHGASSSHPFDVDLGTAGGVSLADSKVSMMQDHFYENDIKTVTENHTFAAETSGTITNHTYHKLGVPAVQLEISRTYRNPRQDIESYYKMIQALTSIVEELSS